jgi:hypothetical protein
MKRVAGKRVGKWHIDLWKYNNSFVQKWIGKRWKNTLRPCLHICFNPLHRSFRIGAWEVLLTCRK